MPSEQIHPDGYQARVCDGTIERMLTIFGAVEISGTKWCGKTWSAREHAKSITYIDEGDNREIASADPSLILLGE